MRAGKIEHCRRIAIHSDFAKPPYFVTGCVGIPPRRNRDARGRAPIRGNIAPDTHAHTKSVVALFRHPPFDLQFASRGPT